LQKTRIQTDSKEFKKLQQNSYLDASLFVPNLFFKEILRKKMFDFVFLSTSKIDKTIATIKQTMKTNIEY